MMVFTQWDSWTVAQHIFHAICSNCDSNTSGMKLANIFERSIKNLQIPGDS